MCVCLVVGASVQGFGDLPVYPKRCANLVCVHTCIVGWADAGVVVDSVDAGGVVLAVVVFAVIRVYLTALALKTRRTHTATKTDTTSIIL